jgi:hypothetical protein
VLYLSFNVSSWLYLYFCAVSTNDIMQIVRCNIVVYIQVLGAPYWPRFKNCQKCHSKYEKLKKCVDRPKNCWFGHGSKSYEWRKTSVYAESHGNFSLSRKSTNFEVLRKTAVCACACLPNKKQTKSLTTNRHRYLYICVEMKWQWCNDVDKLVWIAKDTLIACE